METLPSTPSQPSACPACKAPLKPRETQCPHCGIILAKWKDPAQRAAEQRLAEFAAQANKGLPTWVPVVAILLVLVPLVIVLVPDVGVPLRGAKLRYKINSGSSVRFESHSKFSITSGTTELDNIETQLTTELRSTEKDTGGNLTLVKSYPSLSVMDAATSQSFERAQEKIAPWSQTWVMNPHGGTISTMISVSNQMRDTNMAMQRMAKTRYGEPYLSSQAMPAAPVAAVDPLQQIVDAMSPASIAHLDRTIPFEWPVERVKEKAPIGLSLNTNTAARPFTCKWNAAGPSHVSAFKRTGNGYTLTVKWELPVTIMFLSGSGQYESLNNTTATGTYTGEATFRYSDGLVQQWNDEARVTTSDAVTIVLTTNIKRL